MGETVFNPSRRAQRFAPSRPVTVAFLSQGVPTGYGVVSNISESGTCIQTNVVPQRQFCDVMLSFFDGEYVRATARVVWSDSGSELAKIGVEFTELTDPSRRCLSAKLKTTAFAVV